MLITKYEHITTFNTVVV